MRSIKEAFDRRRQQRRLWRSMRKHISQTDKKLAALSAKSSKMMIEAIRVNHAYAERVINHQTWQLGLAVHELAEAGRAQTLPKAHDHLEKCRQIIREAEDHLASVEPHSIIKQS